MRQDLLAIADPALALVDRDLMHLLASWFNRGFLVLRRIDWQTPAAILEKIIEYEAVHEIQGWDDLRRRLDPGDRRCFAFFHPSRSEEHTSELQSRRDLVCRLLLEKKKK